MIPLDIYDADNDGQLSEPVPQFLLGDRVISCRLDIGADEVEVLTCPGDLDGDNDVDASDLGTLLGAWGPCSGCCADLTGDGEVNAADLGILLGAWGSCCVSMMQGAMASAAGEEVSEIDPPGLAESLGFESVESMCDWLGELPLEAAEVFLAPLFGGD